MLKSEKKSVEKNYLYNLIYQMLIVVIPLITTPYVSRILYADGVGAYSYTTAVSGYFVLFGNLGIATYGQLKIAALQNNKHEISIIFYELFILKIILMIIVLAGYFSFIQINHSNEYKSLYYVLTIHIVASSLDISWFLQGLEEFKKIVIRNIIVKFMSVFLIFMFVRDEGDLNVYTFIMNGSILIGNVSIWVFLPRFLERIKLGQLNFRKHLMGCIIYFIPSIATTLYLTLDKTMLGWFTTSSFENGYYEQAHKIEQMAVTVVTSLSVVTMPRMAFLYKNNEIEKLQLRLNQTIRFILFLAIPMCFGMIAVSDYFVPLFLGNGYDKSILLLKIFSILLVVVGLNNAIGKQILMPIGRQNKYNKGVIFGSIVNIFLNLLLIPRFYSIGAATASVIAEISILLVFIHNSKDFIKLNWIIKSSVKYVIASVIMFGTIRLSYSFLIMKWLNLFQQIIIGIITYITMVIILKDQFIIEAIIAFKRRLLK